MSSTSRAWIAAASIGAVQALRYQGACRWSQALRSLHQRAKGLYNRPFPQSNKNTVSAPASKPVSGKAGAETMRRMMKKKPEEESMRKVMYFSSWGPY